MIILGRDRDVGEWTRLRLVEGNVTDWGPCRTIGITDENGVLIAGVVYNQYRWPSIEWSVVAELPRWCTRRNLAALFAYPFHQLGCKRLGATIAADNHHAQDVSLRLGFRREGVLRHALITGDAVIFGMLSGECRWLPARQLPIEARLPEVERMTG